MIRVLPKTTRSVSYYVQDRALELDGVRNGPAAYWLRGSGVIDDAALGRIWQQPPRSKTVGYDLVFAAPRPFSILLAVGTAEEQRYAVELHRTAVRSALAYLEERALSVRVSMAGETLEQTSRWGPTLAFTHGTNRAGEPHLHDHVLVAAVPSNRQRALDARALRIHTEPADAIYRAELRAGLALTGQRPAWRSFRGHEMVAGIDEGLRGIWPGDGVYGSQKVEWTRQAILSKWEGDLARFVPIHEPRVPQRSRNHLDEQAFASHFEGQLSVSRSELITATANAAVFGASRQLVEKFVDTHYRDLVTDRGTMERRISIAEARQISRIRSHGPRELVQNLEIQRDHPRSIERSR